MVKKPGEVTRYVTANGIEMYPMPGTIVFFPETDADIATRMFILRYEKQDTYLFNPLLIEIRTPEVPDALEEEPEYPEVDR